MDQEVLDILGDYDNELALYKKGDKNARFHQFFAKKNITDHRVLPTSDGSTVVGPRGDLVPSNIYLVKYPNEGYYIGPLNGQFRHGFGYRCYADPELVYAGEYNNNQKFGKGKLWSRKEKRWVFDGNWANDQKNGYGEMWKNGVTYKGNWVEDKLDGIGRMDWPSGQVYEGSFARDFRNGEGTMTFPNGDQYVGSWKNGRPHGKGLYQWKSGEVYQGTWTDGIMDGAGEIEYGIPVKGLGSVRMGSVQELNYQLQRPDDWNADVAKSSQFIRSYRESIIPESVKRQLKAEMTSSVGTAGFQGKPAPTNINFSYANTGQAAMTNAAPGAYNVSTTGFNPGPSAYNTGASNYNVPPPITASPALPPQGYAYSFANPNQGAIPTYPYSQPVQTSEVVSNDKRQVEVMTTGAAVSKVETKVDNLKTAPTGSYANNPLDYVDPKAAARAHIDKNAVSGTYTLTTDAAPMQKAPVITNVTQTFAPGTKGYQSTIEEVGDNSGKGYKDYKITTPYSNPNTYSNMGPSGVAMSNTDTGNLKISRADIGNENVAYADNVYNKVETNVKRVEYNTGGEPRVVTRIN